MPPESEVLAVAQTAARSAAAVLLDYFGRAEVRQKESSQNLVTTADLQSEQTIVRIIGEHFPGHLVLGEEMTSACAVDAEHLWIVDPLDGTSNYAHGIPHFCVSIGYASQGQRQVGVVLDPIRDELFTAIAGGGARLNGVPIRVSQPLDLTECLIATGFFYERGDVMERTLDSLRELFHRNIRCMRRMGAAALDLSWIACGRMQGFYEYHLAPWDYAAGSLIVEEAGGVCRDRAGAPLTLDSRSIIAGAATVFESLQQVVAWE